MSNSLGVEPKISKVGRTNDYNDLDNKPTNLSHFIDDIHDIQDINNYNDIPMEMGWYFTSNFNGLKTNLYDYKTGVQLNYEDLSIAGLITVNRKIYKGGNWVFSKKYYDEIYNVNGVHIGTILLVEDVNRRELIISEKYSKNLILKKKNVYLKINNTFGSNNLSQYYIKASIDGYSNEFLREEEKGVLEIDGVLANLTSYQVVVSEVHINEKKLDNYSIGMKSSLNVSDNLLIVDNSGTIVNLLGNERVSIYLELVYSNHESNRITNKANNTLENVVNLENSDVHSIAMSKTFKEAYGGFTGEVYNSTSNNIDEFTTQNMAKAIKDYNVDFLFSAGSGAGFLRGNSQENVYSVTPLGSNSLVRQDRTSSIDEFHPSSILVTSRAETDNDGTDPLGTSYGFGVEFNEPTLSADLIGQGLTDWAGSQEHQQSPATAIVAGKLKKIKDATGAPWHIVRKACRLTASNANNYNIYRGFGVIDVAGAIAIIPSLIDALSIQLAEYFELTSKFPKELKYEHKKSNTPVVKRDIANGLPSEQFKVNFPKNVNGIEVENTLFSSFFKNIAPNGNNGAEFYTSNDYASLALKNPHFNNLAVALETGTDASSFTLKNPENNANSVRIIHHLALGFAFLELLGSNSRLRVGRGFSYQPAMSFVVNGDSLFEGKINAKDCNFSNLPVFENDASASSLSVGDMYRTSTGELRIKILGAQ